MDALVAQWVAHQIPHVDAVRGFGPCVAIGVVDRFDMPVAGVVFHNYQSQYNTIDISTASVSPKWLTKSLIRGIMAYPFDQLGVGRVTAVTPRKATSSRRFLEHFGFTLEGVVRRGFGTDDAVVYGLLDNEWPKTRWKQDRAPQGDRDVASAVKVVRRRRRQRQILSPANRLDQRVH